MISVTSISGGKSSSYMALKFPTDKYIFAPVLTNDPACIIKDQKLRHYCKNKVPNFDWNKGGSRELDQTLFNLMKLEEELGTEINWVAAPFTFEEMCKGLTSPIAKCFGRPSTSTPRLPNSRTRICTQSLKIYPIFWHLYIEGDEEVSIMNIGFRADEETRVNRWHCKNDKIKVSLKGDIEGQFQGCHRHQEIEWRITNFPLFHHHINEQEIISFWKDKGWIFPRVSNCDYCFFHKSSELRLQHQYFPERSKFCLSLEQETNSTFGAKSLFDILNPAQLDLFYKQENSSCLCSD